MLGFKKDGKFRPTGNKSKSPLRKSDLSNVSKGSGVKHDMRYKKSISRWEMQEIEKENVEESLAHILRMYPEGIANVKNLGRDDFARHGDNPRYRIELKHGVLMGDLENLKNNGIDVTSIHATKDGNVAFEVKIPRNLRESSPKKENKIAFALRNMEEEPIKQGYMEVNQNNINETEQEMLRMLFDSKRSGVPLTEKQKKRIAEIERMVSIHDISNAPSPFR